MKARTPLPSIVSQIEKPVASASMFTRSIIDRGKQRFFTSLLGVW
ncbi:hypothetical protein [Geobacillus sp. B4113_201601]|nr:hypothetical protein [Geobacillus sp. B4113_201601]KYD24350.1 hypothetical protein B4113_2384 [Geobacillus sp. B4113_201601]